VEVERSRHCITAAAARDLIRNVPVFVKSVAVISPHDIDEAVRLSRETNADLLQVHSTLSAGDIRALKGLVPQKIIVATLAESEEVLAMAAVAEAVGPCHPGRRASTGKRLRGGPKGQALRG
jgi:phosphoribosylanthranilate isomerase